MNIEESSYLYNKIYNQFIDLVNGKVDKVVVTLQDIIELDFITSHNKVICDNNGNYVCDYVDGRYNNYADILREHFGNRLIQEIDMATGDYIFRKKR